jgi:hypothetical protein
LYRFFVRSNLAYIAIEMVPSYATEYALARQVASLHEAERIALAAGVLTPEELAR